MPWSPDARRRISRAVLGYERGLKGGPPRHRRRWPIERAASSTMRLFELKTDLDEAELPGKTADAYLRTRDPATGAYSVDVATIFSVEDDIGDRYGTGRDNVGSGQHGAYGKARWHGGAWLIFDLQCP